MRSTRSSRGATSPSTVAKLAVQWIVVHRRFDRGAPGVTRVKEVPSPIEYEMLVPIGSCSTDASFVQVISFNPMSPASGNAPPIVPGTNERCRVSRTIPRTIGVRLALIVERSTWTWMNRAAGRPASCGPGDNRDRHALQVVLPGLESFPLRMEARKVVGPPESKLQFSRRNSEATPKGTDVE